MSTCAAGGSTLYTIGHSTHSVEKLIELLKSHGITAVADVRSHPYSRYNPQFNRESLSAALKAASISYAFLGQELGARTEDRSCYVQGKVQYDRLAATDLFQDGLSRVIAGAARHRIALLCAEKDPLDCHRSILVSRHLAARGLDIEHILADGNLESQEDALRRLMAELGLQEHDLFRTHNEVIEEAYTKRGQQIAYTELAAMEEALAPGAE